MPRKRAQSIVRLIIQAVAPAGLKFRKPNFQNRRINPNGAGLTRVEPALYWAHCSGHWDRHNDGHIHRPIA